MADTRKDLPNPSRRAILEAGGALLGANLLSAATAPLAMADLAQPSLPATASRWCSISSRAPGSTSTRLELKVIA